MIDKFLALGTTPVAEDQATPEAHRTKLETEIELWKPIIEAAGVPSRKEECAGGTAGNVPPVATGPSPAARAEGSPCNGT